MSRRPTALLTAVAAASALLAGPALAAHAPQISAHAIFSGGHAIHAGAMAMVTVSDHEGTPKLTQLCVAPAPIDQPSCGGVRDFAPSHAGTTTLKATFADGSVATRSIAVAPAARRLGGPVAIPGHIGCPQVTLFGNSDRRGGFLDPLATLSGPTKVALYNRVGKGRFVEAYGSGKRGFANVACLRRG